MVFTFIATSFCHAFMNFVLFDFPLFIKFRSFSATVYHICDMMLAWWCMLDVEKGIFWSERAYVHIPVMLNSVMDKNFGRYYKM